MKSYVAHPDYTTTKRTNDNYVIDFENQNNAHLNRPQQRNTLYSPPGFKMPNFSLDKISHKMSTRTTKPSTNDEEEQERVKLLSLKKSSNLGDKFKHWAYNHVRTARSNYISKATVTLGKDDFFKV